MNQPREQKVPPRLALAHVSKSFPGVKANEDISLSVQPGEIHALLGENGAGKSTLVKIIYGVQQADQGTISWNGSPVAIPSPRTAACPTSTPATSQMLFPGPGAMRHAPRGR